MTWLYRIPPMISALAFGYGVGMVAPEETIDRMETALVAMPGAQTHGPRAAAGSGAAGLPPWAAGASAVAGLPAPGTPAVVYYPYGIPAGTADGASAPGLGPAGRNGLESRELSRLRTLAARAGAPGSYPLDRGSSARGAGYEPGEADFAGSDDLDPATSEALSRLQLPDFSIAVSRRALTYVRFLTRTDRGRDLFETWLKRSGRYQDMILEQLRERGLPEDLSWVAMIESGFDPRAKSPAGAVGLWQFMRPTGEVYGLEVSPYVDMRRDPILATRAATHHLRDLHQRFGAWELALAAYNMGYEQLLDAIDQAGTSDFNELSRQRIIPTETAGYVPKIVAAALVANNLERYGFDEVDIYKPTSVAELSVPGGTPLSTVAKAAGMSTGGLRTLNPQLLTNYAPPGADYTLYIPSETMSRARAALPAMLSHLGPSSLERGGPLDPVDLLGGGPGKRARLHRMWDEDESLLSMLPKPKRRSLREALGREATDGAAADALEVLADDFTTERRNRETMMYRVSPGDTLVAVARRFGVDVDDLARDNGLDVEARLREGSLLRLLVDRQTIDKLAERPREVGERAGRESSSDAGSTKGRGEGEKKLDKAKKGGRKSG